MSKPRWLVLVCGTGTEVGKTWTACALARRWTRLGHVVRARKPAQSFEAGTDPAVTDAGLLAEATGDVAGEVCAPHRWYEVPMAPPMAAEALLRPSIHLAELLEELRWPEGTDIGLLETAGGVRSPIAEDGDAIALGRAVKPDAVLLVARPRLGVINDTLLSVDALGSIGAPIVMFMNGHSDDIDLDERNLGWLTITEGLAVERDLAPLADRLLAPPE